MNDYQLMVLNDRRRKIKEEVVELNTRRCSLLNHISRVDEKLENLEDLSMVIDIQLNQEIVNGNIMLIVHNLVNKRDELEPMVEIRLPKHPPIFKLFYPIESFLYSPKMKKKNSTEQLIYIDKVKELAMEWLSKQREYTLFFDDIGEMYNQLGDEFIENKNIDKMIKRPFYIN